MSATIISVANRKGGVSKTSTGIFLATALAVNDGRKVLYLDCDSQSSASEYRALEAAENTSPPPYRIRKTDPRFIFEVIDDNRTNHDIIFIDMPRLTREDDDMAIGMILALCDSVLIPITSGELDNMSTASFVRTIERIQEQKEEAGRPFKCAGFAAMVGRMPSEDAASKEFMETLGIPILKNTMPKLVAFAQLQTYTSLLDKNKKTRTRFESFYRETVKFFNL